MFPSLLGKNFRQLVGENSTPPIRRVAIKDDASDLITNFLTHSQLLPTNFVVSRNGLSAPDREPGYLIETRLI